MKLVLSPFLFSLCIAAWVDHINIVGNKHTKNYIIHREIHHPIPGKFDIASTAFFMIEEGKFICQK